MGSVGSMVFGAAIGGTAEALGGGKFANGAVTGAYIGLFNHALHTPGPTPQDANETVTVGAFGSVDDVRAELRAQQKKVSIPHMNLHLRMGEKLMHLTILPPLVSITMKQ